MEARVSNDLILFIFFILLCCLETIGKKKNGVEPVLRLSRRSILGSDYYNFFWFLFSFSSFFTFGLALFSFGVPLYFYPFVKAHLSMNLLSSIESPVVRSILALLCLDFISYLRHYIAHKSNFLWSFHRVHHSPPVMNLLLHWREHPGLMVFKKSFSLPVVAILGLSAEEFATIFLIREMWMMTHHGNLEVSLGPLDYILVTPRFHRSHHLRQQAGKKHQNLGNLFTFWDILFGTANFGNIKDSSEFGLRDQGFDQLSFWKLMLKPYMDSIGKFNEK